MASANFDVDSDDIHQTDDRLVRETRVTTSRLFNIFNIYFTLQDNCVEWRTCSLHVCFQQFPSGDSAMG